MLEAEHLTVSYGAHRALEDVSIRVAAGEICVILGANGAGKSTLLKTIGGMVRAAPGARIAIDGKDITRAKPHKVVEGGLALVPEGRGIFGELTVAENLQLGAYGPQARESEVKRRVEILKLFPRLAERRSQIARTMSGGEQQMVAIGRALMSNPTILMLDEPSLGLSPLLTKDLFKSLKAVRETGVGILLVEQNAKQSLAIADRGYLIENGHITGEGTGAELACDPAVQAAYLGGAASAEQTHAEAIMHDKHRQFYVPAGAVGGGPAPATAAKASDAEGVARPEHRQFYVPAGAVGNGATPAASASPAASPTSTPSGTTVRPEHRRFYVPADAANGGTNGHGHKLMQTLAKNGDTIIMSDQAHELSQHAAEMAKRAARIQREHVEAIRVEHHLSAAAKPAEAGKKPAGSAMKAEKHDGLAALEGRKLKGRGKKLAKKAAKLAKKAEKLAEKALQASK
jgi:branched-chain amino acid transport system ATP-binding protein